MNKLFALTAASLAVCTAAAVYLERKYLKTGKKKFGEGPKAEDLDWFGHTKHEDTYMVAPDGASLHGIVLDTGSRNWAIVVHGYDGEGKDMLGFARHFVDAGFSVLLPDLRGYGLSEGDSTTMGHNEKFDIVRWTECLNKYKNANNIVLFGISMGAATVMLSAGEKLPENVRAVVEDCGYTSVCKQLEYSIKHVVHLPPYPVLWFCDALTRVKDGWSVLSDADCTKAVERTEIPILFIHGDADDFVPFEMHEKLYSACRHPGKEKLVVKGANHTEASMKAPEEYWNKVFGFIEKSF